MKVTSIFRGEVKLFRWKVPKTVLVGLLAVILMYVGVAGVYTVATPLKVSGDTRQHVDYVWQLYNGHLPVRSEGLKYPPIVELYGGFKLQAASANPPFFYMLQAPFIGPLLNENRYEEAVLLGRIINLGFGVLAILSLAWAGWVFGGKRKAIFAVAVPALSVLTFRFVRLNLDFALDALLVFLMTTGIVLSYQLIRHGLKTRYLIPLILLSVIGMATKATYVVVLGISLGAIIVAAIVHGKAILRKSILKGALIALILFVVTALAIGWFYYIYNFSAHGSWISAREPGYTGGREVKTLLDVMMSPSLWALFYGDLVKNIVLSTAITVLALSGFLLTPFKQITKYIKSQATRFVIPLLGLLIVGIFLTQVVHGVGVGAINFRYMLPAIVVFGLFLTFGLLAFKQLRGQLVAIVAIAMGFSSLKLKESSGIMKPVIENDIPVQVPYLLVALFVLGSIILVAVLYKQTASESRAIKS